MNARPLAFVVALTAQLASAQTCTVPDGGAPAHEWMYRLRLDDGGAIEGVAFSNDGNSLYLRTRGQAVNVWEILVYYWPELLGGLSFVVAVPCLLLLWRVRRRPRIVAAPHCRKCNYCVRGVESGVCPECGRPIRRSVIGRPIWRRVAIPTALLALTFAGYGGLWALRAPRSGRVGQWLNWWSYDLESAAWRRGYSLASWVRPVVRILEVDVQSGRTRRTLLTRPSGRHSNIGLQTVPADHALLAVLDPGDALTLLDTRSGRIRRRLESPQATFTRLSSWRQLAGFDDGGRVAYIVRAGPKMPRLCRWDLRTGETLEGAWLDPADGFIHAPHGEIPYFPHPFFHIPRSDPPQFIEIRSAAPNVRIREFSPEDRVVAEFAADVDPYAGAAFPTDASTVYLIDRGGGVSQYRLPGGQRGGWMGLEGHVHWNFTCSISNNSFACDADNRRFVAMATWRPPSTKWLEALFASDVYGLVVGDLETRRWIGRFTEPKDCSDVYMSPDGRHFAAAHYLSNGGAAQHELFVYDLSGLP